MTIAYVAARSTTQPHAISIHTAADRPGRTGRPGYEGATMSQSDEDAIREIEHRFNAAWGRHDPNGMAEALADDAQFITVNGAWTTTRDGFRDLMQRLHGADGAFRTSTRRTPEMHVHFLTPDIAIL